MTTTQSKRYAIDPMHTEVDFVVRHMMISNVRGRFKDVTGTISTDERGMPTRVDVSVGVASVDTHEDKRDAHLRSADFFDVEKHPTMTFASDDIRANGDSFTMRGPLTIAGTAKDVAFEGKFNGSMTDPYGNVRVGYEARATISRKDYGLTFNLPLEGGGVVIGDDVKIEINAEAIQEK